MRAKPRAGPKSVTGRLSPLASAVLFSFLFFYNPDSELREPRQRKQPGDSSQGAEL